MFPLVVLFIQRLGGGVRSAAGQSPQCVRFVRNFLRRRVKRKVPPQTFNIFAYLECGNHAARNCSTKGGRWPSIQRRRRRERAWIDALSRFRPSQSFAAVAFRLRSGIDYNGHMNLGYYLIAIDQAVMRFFAEWVGIGPQMAAEHGVGSFVLQSHMHFMREIRAGDAYEAHIQLLDRDAKRWRYIATLAKEGERAPAASAEQIAMCVDHKTRRSAPLPAYQSARLEALMAAHAALPAPPQTGAPLGIRRRNGAEEAAHEQG